MLSVKDVTFSYESGCNALENVSLTINDGEILCIVGHNGSGKSTLAKMFNGLLIPSSGRTPLTRKRRSIYAVRSGSFSRIPTTR